MNIPDEARELVEKLKYHNYRYYQLNSPVISDIDYDVLYQRFLELKEQYPELPDDVGYPVTGDKVVHKNRMASLRSVKDIPNVLAFFVSVSGMVSCEPKLDGIATELVYRNHHLVSASTRGDGDVGEDITTNILGVPSVPKEIFDGSDIEIYGELFLTKDDLATFNTSRYKSGKAQYSNTRNAVAGVVRAKTPGKILSSVQFFPYTVVGNMAISQYDTFEWLDANKFDTLGHIRWICPSKDIEEYIANITHLRADLSFDIDGLVFKVDDTYLQEMMGEAHKHPKWALAYKFEAESQYSRLDEVVFQVGKSGIVAPVGIITPVTIGGVVITRASLSNINVIREKDIRINDEVLIERANDVIPYIVGPVADVRTGKEVVIEFPSRCPVCNGKLTFSSPHYICTNSDCAGQVVGKIVVGVSRKGFDIYGLGPKRVSEFVDHGILSNIADVFYLEDDYPRQVMEVLGYTPTTVRDILNKIDKAKTVELNKFIRALCIPKVDEMTSMKLAEAYQTVDELRTITGDSVRLMPNVSSETYRHLKEWFNTESNIQLLDRLLAKVIVKECKIIKPANLVVALTGTMRQPRDTIITKILQYGGKVVNKVTNKVHYLIAGEDPGSLKIEAAKRYGIPIMTEDDLDDMLTILKNKGNNK